MTNNIAEKRDYYSLLKFVISAILILIFIFTAVAIYNSNESNNILIEICLGLLTFVGIFYYFIMRREIIEKRESMLINKWRGYLKDFQRDLKNLQKESRKNIPIYQNMLETSQNIQDKLSNIALFETVIDIRRQLLHAVLAFIISIIGFLVDSVTKFSFIPPYNFFPPKTIIYGIFLYGLYRTIELILTWNRIVTSR